MQHKPHAVQAAGDLIPFDSEFHDAPTEAKCAAKLDASHPVHQPEATLDEIRPILSTHSQQVALDAVVAQLQDQGFDGEVARWAEMAGESLEALLARFLVASNWVVDAAATMVKTDVEWRRENKIDELRAMDAVSVLGGVEESVVQKFIPTRIVGFDKTCHPVLVQEMGAQQIEKCPVGVDTLINYHIWLMERCADLLPAQTLKAGRVINQFIVIIDVAGFNLSCLNRANIRFSKLVTGIDSMHYPERLGKAFIVSAHKSVSVAWNLLNPMLDANTIDKIHIMSRPQEYIPVLLEHIDASTLPEQYGGKLKLDTQQFGDFVCVKAGNW